MTNWGTFYPRKNIRTKNHGTDEIKTGTWPRFKLLHFTQSKWSNGMQTCSKSSFFMAKITWHFKFRGLIYSSVIEIPWNPSFDGKIPCFFLMFHPQSTEKIYAFPPPLPRLCRVCSHRVTWEGVDPRQLAARRGEPAEVAAEWSTFVPPQGWTLPAGELLNKKTWRHVCIYIYIRRKNG